MFTLTELLTINAPGTEFSATIDLGSYVDVGDRQAIQVHSVDYVVQGISAAQSMSAAFGGQGRLSVQLTDLNRGGLVFASDRALVSSMALEYDPDAYLSMDSDLYPDNYGKGSDDGRFVVNDQLYVTGQTTAIGGGGAFNVTVRVNASIVSLTAKDFMAIAIQSTAADN